MTDEEIERGEVHRPLLDELDLEEDAGGRAVGLGGMRLMGGGAFTSTHPVDLHDVVSPVPLEGERLRSVEQIGVVVDEVVRSVEEVGEALDELPEELPAGGPWRFV